MSLVMKVFGMIQLLFDIVFKILRPFPWLYNFFNVLTCLPYTLGHLLAGRKIASNLDKCNRPQKYLILYEFEGCPFCRKVREVLSILDLDCVIYPCPRETLRKAGVVQNGRYRIKARQIGGKAQFPLLIDENKSIKMYESDAIIEYLFNTYGREAILPWNYRISRKLGIIPFMIGNLFRPLPQQGILRTPSKEPEQPLELYAYDPSPYCKIVREALTTLELPYVLHNIAIGSVEKRLEFAAKYGDRISSVRKAIGLIQVPFLIDPNFEIEKFESADIVKYLFETYQTGPTVNESFFDYGKDEVKQKKSE